MLRVRLLPAWIAAWVLALSIGVVSVAWVLALPVGVASAATVIEEVGESGEPGQDGESVVAGGVEVRAGDAPADLEVNAIAGRGGSASSVGDPAGAGGDAALGNVFAVSETGDVRVVGSAEAGIGGFGTQTGEAGDGGDVHLRDAVDGDTAGAISLAQRAIGGPAGLADPELGGLGGGATSVLSCSKSAASLEVRSEAFSGGIPYVIVPQRPVLTSSYSGPGKPAGASGRAHNDAGPATALVISSGGSGGLEGDSGPANPGGSAQSWASAVSEGEGHPVRVGAPPSDAEPGRIEVLTGAAVGGSGGSFQPVIQGTLGSPRRLVTAPESLNRPGGDGGDASSFSLGIARGRSPVEVYDSAIGGSAGLQLASFTPVEGQPGLETYEDVGAGVGGEASSVVVGLGSAEPIQVRASAIGGPASNLTEVVPEGAEPFDPANDIFVGGAVIEIVDATDDGSGLSSQFVPINGGSGSSIPFPTIAIDDVQFFGVVSDPFVPIGGGSGPSNQFVQRVRVLGEFGESGGPAHAKAQAVGSGLVEADAEATGGAGSLWSTSYAHLRHEGGPARAEASGTGSEGRVGAVADSNAPTLSLKIGAATTLLQTARVEARIAPDALDPPKLGRRGLRRLFSLPDATAYAVISPPPSLSDAPVAHDAGGPGALEDRIGSARPAAGRWSARHRQRGWGSPVESTWTLELRSERNLFDDPVEQYRVALLAPEISGWGFRSLRVTLKKEGEVLVDETFSEAEAARAYLEGRVLEVGTLAGIPLPFPTPSPPVDGGTSSGIGTEIGNPILDPRLSEAAVLTIELVTDRTGATASLDFVVARLPIDTAP